MKDESMRIFQDKGSSQMSKPKDEMISVIGETVICSSVTQLYMQIKYTKRSIFLSFYLCLSTQRNIN